MTQSTKGLTAATRPSSITGYDKWMVDPLHAAFFDHSDFYNYGYSTNETDSQSQACINLVEKLLGFIPDKNGTILDVACGLGASTRHLLKYYRPADVTAATISEIQLERARHNAPGCTFRTMDAVNLDFPDNTFDNIICIESAFHFNTREQFLRETLRVLKPGGRLVMSDILGWLSKAKEANYVKGPAVYEEMLRRVGFGAAHVLDATQQCSSSCSRRLRRWPGRERQAGRLGFKDYSKAWIAGHLYAFYMRVSQRYYLLVAAQKPAAT
jgi:MPBQ/MSBQ methyltransferase